ncbi:MAG: hypothetical protein ACOX6T_11205 [Myxococcales bacterium]|jgi:predicted metalloprotease with PDZ domain
MRSLTLAATLAIATACAHGQLSAPAPLAEDLDVSWTLTPVTEPFPMLQVVVQTRGDASGETVFAVDREWGGTANFENEVHGLLAEGTSGVLPIDRPASNEWRVRHAPGEPITLRYWLVSTRHDLEARPDSYYRPIIRKGLFHVIGHTGLLFPKTLSEGTRRIGLSWRGLREAGVSAVSSFGGEEPVRVELEVDDFLHGVFLAGRLRVHERIIREKAVHFALFGDDHGFQDEELISVATKIFQTERDFWSDHEPPRFLVTLIPVGQYNPNGSSTGGTGLTNSFALFLSPRMKLEGDLGNRIKNLLAHELFHRWVGGAIRPDERERAGYWFTEGFTTFYTRRMLLRAGLWSRDEYFADLNESLRDYMLNPMREEPNSRIEADFWKNHDVEKLAYQRGDVVALLIDAEIRRVSSGSRSLDDLMRDLLERTRKGESLPNARIFELVEAWTSAEFANKVRAIVMDGRTAALDESALSPCLSVRHEPTVRFELGFDMNASRPDRTVRGVIPDSPAAKAGLRDGMKLAGWSVNMGNTRAAAEFTVLEDGQRRTISFLPRGPEIQVPIISFGTETEACANAL